MHPPRPTDPTSRRRIRAPLALAVLGSCLVLAACGSSATSSTSTTSTSASTPTTSTPGSKSKSSRFTALRSCLQKQGITLPAPSGGRPAGGPGGFQPPAGVSQTQYQEALKKCGGRGAPNSSRFNSAAGNAALTKYVACMRENGVNLPAPNTSGKGPVFNTQGVNTASATFTSAQSKCQSDLRAVLGGGAPNGGPPNGGPPSSEAATG
jgi:hypothetical protein